MVPNLRGHAELPRLREAQHALATGTAMMGHPVDVGDVVEIAEGDYCYGVGTLLIRITEIASPHPQFPNATWTFVKGIELRPSGDQVAERHLLVRVSALRDRETR